ncbi:MAG TPA: NAD(P)-dependent alcohol dehydrogenase [Gemmatimonadales bacterium]|nr:NAD(P)-dependent alcohol dehydrogenase [Gemmatimonadales bacterium]
MGTRVAAERAPRAAKPAAAATMKAFVMHGIGRVGFMEKPVPADPGPDDAIIRTTHALICTSDTHTVAGAIGARSDLTLGHEAVGIVERIGANVKGVQVGDRVAVNAITPCYKCDNCQRGFTSQCTEMLGGWKFGNTKDGVFAEYFHVNDADANLAVIPATVPDDKAVYATDMMSTGFMAAEHANIPIGGSVAIFAQGPVGLMATVGARLLGAGLVIAVESAPKRKDLATRFGADVVVDHTKMDAVEAIRSLTNGHGVDSAIEALGSEETFDACIRATRPGGTISNVGYHGKGEYLRIPRVAWGVGMSDKTIRTGLCPGGRERMMRLLRLIENGRVDPTPLTTHRFPFAELDKAFELMSTKGDRIIKPLITF